MIDPGFSVYTLRLASAGVVSTERKTAMVRSNECHVCFASLGRSRRGIRQYCDHPYHEACLTTWRQTNPRWNGQCFYCETPLGPAPVQAPGILERLNRVLLRDTDVPADEELKVVDGEEIVRRCPRCLVHFVRDGGCEHITCRCGHEFLTRGVSAEQQRGRLPGVPDCAILSIGLVLGFCLLMLMAMTMVRKYGICEAIHAEELRESMCYPCFHELQLLQAKIDDYEYCDANDLSTAMLRYESASAGVEHVWKKMSCDWCRRSKTQEVEKIMRSCREREEMNLVWAWFPWGWIPVMILGVVVLCVVVTITRLWNGEHRLPRLDHPDYRIQDALLAPFRHCGHFLWIYVPMVATWMGLVYHVCSSSTQMAVR